MLLGKPALAAPWPDYHLQHPNGPSRTRLQLYSCDNQSHSTLMATGQIGATVSVPLKDDRVRADCLPASGQAQSTPPERIVMIAAP